MSASEAYKRIRNFEAAQMANKRWRFAPRWRNRVGLPRAAAAGAAFEALYLLRSINLGTFRSDPELAERLVRARAAVDDLAMAVAQDNWRRFNGKEKTDA